MNGAGGSIRVIADQDRCIGSGLCSLAVPEVFDQSEQDGTVVLLDDHPPESALDEIEEAVRSCPAQALRIGSAGD